MENMETFFYNTIPKRPMAYTIHKEWVSEVIHAKRMELQKREGLKHRWKNFAFAYQRQYNKTYCTFRFDSKIIRFNTFLIGVISLAMGNVVSGLARTTERTKFSANLQIFET